jgi:hypothetical protein
MPNGSDPATKQDVLDAAKASEDRVIETMRDIQTELLKAFYSFTASNQQRLAQVEGNEGAVVARLGTLEARVTDLERKINFPNQ